MIVFAVLLTSISLNAQDQNKNNEISASYGILSIPEFEELIVDVTSSLIGGADSAVINGSIGNIYLNYQHSLGEKFVLGFTFGYYKADYKSFKKSVQIGDQTNYYYTFAIESKYKYIDHDKFQMYSGAGIGLTYNPVTFKSNDGSPETKDSFSNFTFQIIGAGVRYGKNFGIFAEAGFGYKGILNGGVSFKF